MENYLMLTCRKIRKCWLLMWMLKKVWHVRIPLMNRSLYSEYLLTWVKKKKKLWIHWTRDKNRKEEKKRNGAGQNKKKNNRKEENGNKEKRKDYGTNRKKKECERKNERYNVSKWKKWVSKRKDQKSEIWRIEGRNEGRKKEWC